jgi:hypothetical protein
MAGLLGSADTTIVNAALKEAESKVVKDLSGVYDKREKALKDFNTGITSIFEGIAAKEKVKKAEIEALFKDVYNIIDTSTSDYSAMYQMNNDTAKNLKIQYKNAKTDEERQLVNRELNRFTNAVKANDKFFTDLIAQYDSVMLSDYGSDEQDLIKSILSDFKENTNNTKVKYDKGEIVYTHPTKKDSEGKSIQLSIKQIKDKLGLIDNTALVDISAIFKGIQENTNDQSLPHVLPDAKTAILNTLSTPNRTENVARNRQINGMNGYSIQDYLTGNVPDGVDNVITKQIFEAIGRVNFDADGDGQLEVGFKEGVVNEDDKLFAQNPKNGAAILEALKNDSQAYKDVIADVLANIAAKHAAKTNIANKKAAETLVYNTEIKMYKDKLDLATEARIKELLEDSSSLEEGK